MKEFSREWFIAQAAASSRVVESWPEPIRRNMVLASASLPTTLPTKAEQSNPSTTHYGSAQAAAAAAANSAGQVI